jgi:hypothetical protein
MIIGPVRGHFATRLWMPGRLDDRATASGFYSLIILRSREIHLVGTESTKTHDSRSSNGWGADSRAGTSKSSAGRRYALGRQKTKAIHRTLPVRT